MSQPDSDPTSTPIPNPPKVTPDPPQTGSAWPMAILTALLTAQLCLTWMHGRMLQRQHEQLLDVRDELQGLAEAFEATHGEAGPEGSGLAPAVQHRRQAYRLQLASTRIQEQNEGQPPPERPPEQDRAAKEIENARASMDKAVKDAKVAQEKLSIQHAAERAARQKELDQAWSFGTKMLIVGAIVGLGAFVLRSYLRRRG